MVNDKDPETILKHLPKEAEYYFTKASLPRALDERILMDIARNHELIGKSFPTVKQAFDNAKNNANQDDIIYIGGSTFIVAEALLLWNEKK